MNTTGADVKNVVIDGRTVMREGTIPGLDWESLRPQAQDGFDAFRDSFSWFDAQRRTGDALFPAGFEIR